MASKNTSKSTSSTSGAAMPNVTTRNMKKAMEAADAARGIEVDADMPLLEEGNDHRSGSSTPLSSPRGDQEETSALRHAAAMTTQASTLEEQMSNLTKIVEMLVKRSELQDARMEQMMNRLDGSNGGQAVNKPVEIRDDGETSRQGASAKGKATADVQVTPDGFISADQLKEFITGLLLLNHPFGLNKFIDSH